MRFVVADLEWNGAYSKKAHGYFNEIIEIGAVMLDDRMNIVDRFHAMIKPVVSTKLSEIVTDLTSITSEELETGTTFSKAVSCLCQWIGGEAVFLTWSTTDLLVLIENCRYFLGTERIPFLTHYVDLQRYAQQRMEVETGQQMGLSRACEELGIGAEDMTLHRALDDSMLTGLILQKVYEPASFTREISVADEAFYERITFKTTIISDIDSPLIKRSDLLFRCEDCGQTLKQKGKWRFRNRAFVSDLICGACDKRYTGRVQVKLKYEGLEVKRKLTEKPQLEESAEEPTVASEKE